VAVIRGHYHDAVAEMGANRNGVLGAEVWDGTKNIITL
jgi:hypothetical protein